MVPKERQAGGEQKCSVNQDISPGAKTHGLGQGSAQQYWVSIAHKELERHQKVETSDTMGEIVTPLGFMGTLVHFQHKTP